MVAKKKKVRAKWDTEIERKLIDIWADILDEYNRRMITRKKREVIVTIRLNLYIEEDLDREDKYIEKEVCNKIDTQKGKANVLESPKEG